MLLYTIKDYNQKKVVIDILIPVRCFGCGKPVAGLWEKYKERVERGEEPKKVLDDLGLERYCCRAMFLTHVDLIQKVGKFRV